MTELSRLLLRPWRDSAFRVLALSLFIAALALSTIVLLRAELDARFDRRGAEMLGGDIELDGSRPAEPQQLALLDAFETSHNIRFSSVLVDGDNILLVGVKAVDQHWPLYGTVLVADDRFAPSRAIAHGPARGEAWVGEQVLDRLHRQVGDQVSVGDLALRITRVVRQEPDQGAGFYSMTPRVLMHIDDLPATGVLAQGSRANYEVSVRTDDITGSEALLKPTLRPDQEIDTVTERQARSMGPMRQMTLWISLGVLLIALLCGAAIYLTTSLRVARKAKLAALLRTFGASRRTVMARVLGEEVVAVLPPITGGIVAGVAITLAARTMLGWQEPLAAGAWEGLAVCLAPLLLFAAFALPRLASLVQVPAIQVLNRSHGSSLRRSGLELAAALAGPVLLAALLIGSLRELLTLLLLLAGLGAALPLLLWPVLRAMDRAANRWPVARRLAIRRLSRRPGTTLPLLAALSLAMTILTVAGLSGSGLLADWRNKLPDDAPNHFIINLFDQDRDILRAWQDRHGARAEPLYPIVRGRLTGINDQPVREAVTKENDRAERALNRDLALTEGDTLPRSNQVVDGDWHGDGPPPSQVVSVEKELADSLGLALDDRLTFVTSRGELSARVTSIREVDWESFEPNFYFMFSPGSFADQDITWLTSFWLPPGDGQRLAELMQQLPHITLFDVNAILDQAQDIITQASQATALLASLLIAASMLVLSAALLATARQRQADEALLRVFGARRALLASINRLEFLALGLSAAAVATLIVLLALAPLGVLLFDGRLPAPQWLLLPPALGLAIAAAGLFSLRRSQAVSRALLQE